MALLQRFKIFFQTFFGKSKLEARTIPRSQHTISRKGISPNAIKVLYRLKNSGFAAFMVGGGVRDLLLEHVPKDFDVATNATPEQVRKLFGNSLLIGRRFKLVHVRFGREIVEVATFRAGGRRLLRKTKLTKSGMIIRDNIYGSIEEDAIRRDFTINALYYNIADFSLVDYANGYDDLQSGVIRLIGNPIKRYKEDPVRMLRAVRFAAKLGFQIEEETAKPIIQLRELLKQVPSARLFDEILKLLLSGHCRESYELLKQYQLFDLIFPDLDACMKSKSGKFAEPLLLETLKNTDERIASNKKVSVAFLFSALLWYPLQKARVEFENQGLDKFTANRKAIAVVINHQAHLLAIPRRIVEAIRLIWNLQHRLTRRNKNSVSRIIHQARFRAGYDLLLLRVSAGENVEPLAEWWTDYLQADEAKREELLSQLSHVHRPRKRKKKSHE